MCDFVTFLLFAFTLVIKLRKPLKYFNIFLTKNYITSDLNMSSGKISDFASFPLFGFTLVIKLKNFDLKVIEIL